MPLINSDYARDITLLRSPGMDIEPHSNVLIYVINNFSVFLSSDNLK